MDYFIKFYYKADLLPKVLDRYMSSISCMFVACHYKVVVVAESDYSAMPSSIDSISL